ncbi:MAG: aminotransferase class III-fold pyridoxal phosphate-dependent enzyme [Planctomycetes bacterium]|nr:aminotransferase class III-fold pyridoxal phosphate-dependent enzyme [Planctomycetota bacterium]
MAPPTANQELQALIERENKYVLPTYAKHPLILGRGEGCDVFDSQGKRYLDFYGGHAVCILGHSHPKWVEAVSRQARDLGFYSGVCYHPARAAAAEHLVTKSYPSMAQVFFCNSGTEANETALKLARRFTGRGRVIAMLEGFHGRTIGSLSATGIEKLRAAYPENLARLTDFVRLGDLEAVRSLNPNQTAAIILEPVQSMAGVRLAPPEYYRGLREHCSRHGIVLIFDEVQTGAGRTGKWFVGAHWEVEPDLVTCAKGIGGGFPVGAVIVSKAIAATVKYGDHGSTFGGGPLAARAVQATFSILEEEKVVERVAAQSREAIRQLKAWAGKGIIQEVRGLGYLIGIECQVPGKDVAARLREKGVLAGTSDDPNTFRLLPPLVAGAAEWDRFFQAFEPLALGKE